MKARTDLEKDIRRKRSVTKKNINIHLIWRLGGENIGTQKEIFQILWNKVNRSRKDHEEEMEKIKNQIGHPTTKKINKRLNCTRKREEG